MDMNIREIWALVHGLVLGSLFLLAFAGGLAELYLLRPSAETEAGVRGGVRRLGIGVTSMAVVAWLTVITGTWVVYPWYREPGAGSAKSTLIDSPGTEAWHSFAMEWKEHIAWLAPILATVAAFIILYYKTDLSFNVRLRRITTVIFVLAFLIAGVAGAFGALITKAAAV